MPVPEPCKPGLEGIATCQADRMIMCALGQVGTASALFFGYWC